MDDKGLNYILNQVKNNNMSVDTARRQLLVVFGVNKSSICRLDRLPKDCCIYANATPNCEFCGHYIK